MTKKKRKRQKRFLQGRVRTWKWQPRRQNTPTWQPCQRSKKGATWAGEQTDLLDDASPWDNVWRAYTVNCLLHVALFLAHKIPHICLCLFLQLNPRNTDKRTFNKCLFLYVPILFLLLNLLNFSTAFHAIAYLPKLSSIFCVPKGNGEICFFSVRRLRTHCCGSSTLPRRRQRERGSRARRNRRKRSTFPTQGGGGKWEGLLCGRWRFLILSRVCVNTLFLGKSNIVLLKFHSAKNAFFCFKVEHPEGPFHPARPGFGGIQTSFTLRSTPFMTHTVDTGFSLLSKAACKTMNMELGQELIWTTSKWNWMTTNAFRCKEKV